MILIVDVADKQGEKARMIYVQSDSQSGSMPGLQVRSLVGGI